MAISFLSHRLQATQRLLALASLTNMVTPAMVDGFMTAMQRHQNVSDEGVRMFFRPDFDQKVKYNTDHSPFSKKQSYLVQRKIGEFIADLVAWDHACQSGLLQRDVPKCDSVTALLVQTVWDLAGDSSNIGENQMAAIYAVALSGCVHLKVRETDCGKISYHLTDDHEVAAMTRASIHIASVIDQQRVGVYLYEDQAA